VSLFGPDTRWALARMRALCDHLNAASPHNPARTPVE
jgi:hypothetical protein